MANGVQNISLSGSPGALWAATWCIRELSPRSCERYTASSMHHISIRRRRLLTRWPSPVKKAAATTSPPNFTELCWAYWTLESHVTHTTMLRALVWKCLVCGVEELCCWWKPRVANSFPSRLYLKKHKTAAPDNNHTSYTPVQTVENGGHKTMKGIKSKETNEEQPLNYLPCNHNKNKKTVSTRNSAPEKTWQWLS